MSTRAPLLTCDGESVEARHPAALPMSHAKIEIREWDAEITSRIERLQSAADRRRCRVVLHRGHRHGLRLNSDFCRCQPPEQPKGSVCGQSASVLALRGYGRQRLPRLRHLPHTEGRTEAPLKPFMLIAKGCPQRFVGGGPGKSLWPIYRSALRFFWGNQASLTEAEVARAGIRPTYSRIS